MKLTAITGSIGCGKTTIARIINRMGYTVFDVDGWVRRLYFQKEFIKVIAAHFPQVVHDSCAIWFFPTTASLNFWKA